MVPRSPQSHVSEHDSDLFVPRLFRIRGRSGDPLTFDSAFSQLLVKVVMTLRGGPARWVWLDLRTALYAPLDTSFALTGRWAELRR